MKRPGWRQGGMMCALALIATPCLGQIRGEVQPAASSALSGATLTISVDVDLGTTGKLLGSYGASLRWNPAVLQYVSDTGGGQFPFDSAVVNRADVGTGLIRFSDASATGATGRVNIFNVSFRVVGRSLSETALDLDFTSLFSAGTFENLEPMLEVRDGVFKVAATRPPEGRRRRRP